MVNVESSELEVKPKSKRASLSDKSFVFEMDEEDDYVSIRKPGVRRVRILAVIALMAILAIGLFFMARSWFISQIDPAGLPGEIVEIVILPDTKNGSVASLLQDNEIVPNSTFFSLWSTYRSAGEFEAGTYLLNKNMSVDEALVVLKNGPLPVNEVTFTVPEQKWVSETLKIVASQIEGIEPEDLQEVLDDNKISAPYRPEGIDSWEGLLFPGEYTVNVKATPEEIVGLLVKGFSDAAQDADYGAARVRIGMDPYDVIIIASLIELETDVEADRAAIAQVIYNRLRDNKWLDIDQTLLYSASLENGGQRITLSELSKYRVRADDPYNTSPRGLEATRDRLPPTPIVTPSAESLYAAINPIDSSYLYYVVKNEDGEMFFSETEDQHDNATRRARSQGLLQ